jgi:hypothetical protein
MKYELELWLWYQIQGPKDNMGLPCDTRVAIQQMHAEGLIRNPKQAWRTLEKWARKGWYQCGVTLDCGWRTVNEAPFKPPC